MTNSTMLRQILKESGVTIAFLARKMKCSRNRIYAILKGKECTATEIVVLTEALHLTNQQRDKIFLNC